MTRCFECLRLIWPWQLRRVLRDTGDIDPTHWGMGELDELCRQCEHPIGWHPRPGSPSAQSRMGCLECSCDYDGDEARGDGEAR